MVRIENSSPDDKELALRILSWISRALRPLRMNELLEALVTEVVLPNTTLEEALQCLLSPSDIIECCKSLVIYEESSGLVRFAHFTVQEFLNSHAPADFPPQTHLAKTCLAYLAFPEFDEPSPIKSVLQDRLEKYEFSQYAAQYWGRHSQGDAEIKFENEIFEIFQSQGKCRADSGLGCI